MFGTGIERNSSFVKRDRKAKTHRWRTPRTTPLFQNPLPLKNTNIAADADIMYKEPAHKRGQVYAEDGTFRHVPGTQSQFS